MCWWIVRRRSTFSPLTRSPQPTRVVVPLQCEFFALEGLSQLLTTVLEQVRSTLNPALTIHGVVLTMYDPRNSLAGQVVADVRAYMGDLVYETVIPRNGPACPKRLRTASRRCFTISNAPAARPISSSRPRSFAAKRGGAPPDPKEGPMAEDSVTRTENRPRLGRGLAALLGRGERAACRGFSRRAPDADRVPAPQSAQSTKAVRRLRAR